MTSRIESFRTRLRSGAPLLGTFIKTPSSIVAEVLAKSSLDVLCLDAEHAPFSRLEQDQCLAIFRALDVPSLVRVPSNSQHDIRYALDSGATGILVPHVRSASQAQAIVKAAYFGDGGRGYAGSTRAAEFTTLPMADYLAQSREQTTVVLQIEDLDALENVAEIAGVDGVDALFIGRVDLAVAMGKPVSDDAVLDAVRGICEASRNSSTSVGMFTPGLDELKGWIDQGASLFLLDSDQGFMLQGAERLVDKFRHSIS